MAKITQGDKEMLVTDGDSIMQACDSLGVPFSCHVGTCGVCKIEIIKGKENLSELTEEEKELGMDEDNRLACQCKIKKGEVKIK